MMFSPDFIEKVKTANNIIDVAGSYMPIKQKGRQYWACCPFHHEKTPSFAIYEDTQSYYCFGCHVGGGVFKLVEQLENCDFGHAVEILAKRAGITLPVVEANPELVAKQKMRDRLRLAVDTAREYFCSNLVNSTPTSDAKKYLHGRGITDEIIAEFNIGLSLDFNSVIKHLKAQGFSEREILESGVASKSDKGIYDAMAKRIVFHIFDTYGHCIGATGRVLPADDNGSVAKYRNTAQTLLFDKGKIVYGGDVLKKHMRQEHIESLIVVEGNVDVISLVSKGFNNTVACMGTAMTMFHVEQFSNFSNEIYLCFDGDSAGRKATLRAIEIFEQRIKEARQKVASETAEQPARILDKKIADMSVRIITLPTDVDPDGFVTKNGAEKFQKLVDTAKPATAYKLDDLWDSIKTKDEIGRKKYHDMAIKILGNDKSAIELYGERITERSKISVAYKKVVIKTAPKIPDKTITAIDLAKKHKEEIDKGIASGTNQEIEKLKIDSEIQIEIKELLEKRNQTTDPQEMKRINDKIKELNDKRRSNNGNI